MLLRKQTAVDDDGQTGLYIVQFTIIADDALANGGAETGGEGIETGFMTGLELREELREDAGQGCQLRGVGRELQPGVTGYAVLGIIDGIEHGLGMGDEEGSGGSRGLYTRVAHHVEDALVAVVTNAGDNGQRKLSDVLGKGKGVEAREVGGGTTTTDDDDTIISLNPQL